MVLGDYGRRPIEDTVVLKKDRINQCWGSDKTFQAGKATRDNDECRSVVNRPGNSSMSVRYRLLTPCDSLTPLQMNKSLPLAFRVPSALVTIP